MKRSKAIQNVAIATGITVEDVERMADSMGQFSVSAEDLKAHLESVGKAMRQLSVRDLKSYVSPYAKFDKYHKKKRK
ncbi:MAG: hypothetical protein HDS21_00200 [Bacteroides sp.]|nr:hypothetical protein [Bacteroides sp.]